MGFIASVFTAIIDIVVAVIVTIVEVVVQIVEIVIHLIMILLGWEPDSHTIEYFEVRNIPLFTDVDQKNPLLAVIMTAIRSGSNMSKDITYSLTHRSLKSDFQEFIDFIDDGNYFESFPTVESFILVVDYTELTAALLTLEGAACTPETTHLTSVNYVQHIQYWLQENKTYDVGVNRLGTEFDEVSTSPAAIPADTIAKTITVTITDAVATEDSLIVNTEDPVTTSPATPPATVVTVNYTVALTSAVATEDDLFADSRWQVDLSSSGITYNPGTDDYTIDIYNDEGGTDTLPYTAGPKPLQLHYISYYYINSDPDRQYLFLYQVGEGTYPDLDTVETPIDIAGATLEVVPSIPLRISNSNYTTFGATKAAQIVDICNLVHLDAAEILDEVLNDPDADPGDIDNVYINFGVRVRDTSQIGMTYLFNMFENLFPSQGSTKADYDNTASGDDKPVNNIIIDTDDNKYVFQWSYITFTNTSLAAIDAAPASDEYAVYYSDASRFDPDTNLLIYPYYSSSAKTTYNVGFKADNLTEVADFLTGSGTVNPGTVSSEGAQWLQVTTRMSYNNTTPVLKDPDDTTSALLYLTPDMVYENNGAGVLRVVEQASEETTRGQSITFYCMDEAGLDAYTVVAPVGAMKVIDGDTGVFKTVRFNLGHEDDLMAPFIHSFIADLSNRDVTQLFLNGAHVSIYIAHYEVIEPAGMSFLTALVLLVVIVVVAYVAYQAGAELAAKFQAQIAAGVAAGATVTAATTAVLKSAFYGIVEQILIGIATQFILTEVAENNEELAFILALAGAVVLSTYDIEGALTSFDYAKLGVTALQNFNTVNTVKVKRLADELNEDIQAFDEESRGELEAIEELYKEIFGANAQEDGYTFDGLTTAQRVNLNPMYPDHYFTMATGQITSQYLMYEPGAIIDLQVSGDSAFI